MKKILTALLLISVLLLSGCSLDSTHCYKSTQKAYPSATVEKVPNTKYSFFVYNTDGSMYFVQTMSVFHSRPTLTVVIPERKSE